MKHIEYTKEDFKWTQWQPYEMMKLKEQAIELARANLEAIKAVAKDQRTFANTIYAIEVAELGVSDLAGKLHVLQNAHPLKQVRDTAKNLIEDIEKISVDLAYDEGVYRAAKEYAEKGEMLEGEDKKLFDDMMRDYHRMGFGLPVEQREELKQKLKEINTLSSAYDDRVRNWKGHIEVTREELEGCAESFINGLQQLPGGSYKISIDYPELHPFLENAKNWKKRKELADVYSQVGGLDNIETLKKILRLRRDVALMLGYPNYVAYATEDRMAKNPENVKSFVDDLMQKLKLGLEKEMDELRQLKLETKIEDDSDAIEYYDTKYYTEQLQQQKYNFSAEKVREYFPLEVVVEGIFRIYSKLFSIRFEKISEYPKWHSEVTCFKVLDIDGGILGYLMLDMHPREGKYKHAAEFDIIKGRIKTYGSKEYITPMACLMMNFRKPTVEYPSLLSHEEVETFFHEFGHAMHELLTTASYASHAGTSVAVDFVEAPSQMLENWVWDKEMLKLMSGHYRDYTQKLPEDLLNSMLSAKNHGIAYFTTRQLVFALFDYLIHIDEPPADITALYHSLVKEWVGIAVPDADLFPANFGHLVGMYGAGYYGYMWSKVRSSDMFTRFNIEGLLNSSTGSDYKHQVLEKGSTREEADLVRAFLGRESNNEAFLKEIGL